MDQKKFKTAATCPRPRSSVGTLPDPGSFEFLSDPHELEKLRKLIEILDKNNGELPFRVQRSLRGFTGMRRLVVAMTELLTSYCGCSSPETTSSQMAEDAPHLYEEFGGDRVLALCEELQLAECPQQSEELQEMFQAFNVQYFSGRLPEYRILVVFDVMYWKTEILGFPVSLPPFSATGFIDFRDQIILIGPLAGLVPGATLQGTLLHEMAHAATDGDHGDMWRDEIKRLKLLGAPIDKCDLEIAEREGDGVNSVGSPQGAT